MFNFVYKPECENPPRAAGLGLMLEDGRIAQFEPSEVLTVDEATAKLIRASDRYEKLLKLGAMIELGANDATSDDIAKMSADAAIAAIEGITDVTRILQLAPSITDIRVQNVFKTRVSKLTEELQTINLPAPVADKISDLSSEDAVFIVKSTENIDLLKSWQKDPRKVIKAAVDERLKELAPSSP